MKYLYDNNTDRGFLLRDYIMTEDFLDLNDIISSVEILGGEYKPCRNVTFVI